MEFRLAVTGHRHIKSDEKLTKSIRDILDRILQENKGAEVWLYTALAEGSDQLVAKIANDIDEIKLVVPLPFPVEQYLTQFETEDGKKDFIQLLKSASEVINLPVQPDPQSAYTSLGDYLVNACDTVVALWNGENNLKKGGTAEVVLNAIDLGKPVYWIYCDNPRDVNVLTQKNHMNIGEIHQL